MARCQSVRLRSRLDSLLSAAMIAHEAIFEMRRKLIAADRISPEQTLLLKVGADCHGRAVGLVGQCPPAIDSISGLDPEGATKTIAELETELNRVEHRFLSLHKRQRQVARQMRAMLES